MSGPLTGDAGAAAAVCTEMRRAQAFDTIDSLVRYTARSTVDARARRAAHRRGVPCRS